MSLCSPLSADSSHFNLEFNSNSHHSQHTPYQPEKTCVPGIPAHHSTAWGFTSHLRQPTFHPAHLRLPHDMSCGSGNDAQTGQTNPPLQNAYWPIEPANDDRFGISLVNFREIESKDSQHRQLFQSSTEAEDPTHTVQEHTFDFPLQWAPPHCVPSIDQANQLMYGNPHDLFAHLDRRNDCESDNTQLYGTSYSSTNFHDQPLGSSPLSLQMELYPHMDNSGINFSASPMDACISSPESFIDGDPGSPEDHETEMPYNKRIYYYLLRAPNYELTLKELYKKFEEDVIHSVNPSSKGWQNSIRHNLSMNEAFQKGSRDPNNTKKNVWSLTDEAIQNGIQPTTRFRNHNRSRLRTRHLHASGLRSSFGAKGTSAARRSARARPTTITYRAESDSLPDAMLSREATAAPATPMNPSMSPEITNMHLRAGDQFRNFSCDYDYSSPAPFTFPMDEEYTASAANPFEGIVSPIHQGNSGNSIDPALMLKMPDPPEASSDDIQNHDKPPQHEKYHQQQQYHNHHIKTPHVNPSNLTAFYYDGGSSRHIHNLTETHGPDLFYSSTDEEVNSEPITPGEYPTQASSNLLSSGNSFFAMPPYSNV